ncbi:MAG: LysM peptidoglycan-binding domain-containing protein, partial [bacterium]
PVAPEEPVMEQAPVAVEESPVEKMPVATRESEIEVESEEEAPASVEEAETPSRKTVEKARVPVAMKTHVVKRGETLSSIAKRYRVSLKKLVEVNKIDDPGRIRAGQSLVIPNSR